MSSAGIRWTSATPSGLAALAPHQEDHATGTADDTDEGHANPPRGAIRLKSGPLKQQYDKHHAPHCCAEGYGKDRILV